MNVKYIKISVKIIHKNQCLCNSCPLVHTAGNWESYCSIRKILGFTEGCDVCCVEVIDSYWSRLVLTLH